MLYPGNQLFLVSLGLTLRFAGNTNLILLVSPFGLLLIPPLYPAAESRAKKAEVTGATADAGEQRKLGLARLHERKRDLVSKYWDGNRYVVACSYRCPLFDAIQLKSVTFFYPGGQQSTHFVLFV